MTSKVVSRDHSSIQTLLGKPGIVVSQHGGNMISDHVEFVDESGRNIIYDWSIRRQKNQKNLWNRTKIYLISCKMLGTFIKGISLSVLMNILLTVLITFLCQKYDISFDLQATLLLTPIIFPVSFLINNDFQRRENALIYISRFKKNIYDMFLQSRELGKIMKIKKTITNNMYNKLKQIVFHVTEYVLTYDANKRCVIVKIIYEDLSDISQIISDYYVCSPESPYIGLTVMRLFTIQEGITASFEQLRIIRDYRSPFSTRAFAKVMSFLLPLLLCPFYVEISSKVIKTELWSAYTIGIVFSFTMGTMQSVQDRLYDPFLSYSIDAINVSEMRDWAAESLVHTAMRSYKVGRFRVSSQQDTRIVLDNNQPSYYYPLHKLRKHHSETKSKITPVIITERENEHVNSQP